jgi:acyl dehydratase
VHVLPTVPALLELEGTDLGAGPWRTFDQPMVDTFADLTDDHQWIHVDPERAAEGPFGTTVAHGMLTLAFVPVMVGEVLRVDGASFGLNYGFEKIRFTSPVPVGSRVRGQVRCTRAVAVEGGVRATFAVTVEVEGADRPACVAENVIMWLE